MRLLIIEDEPHIREQLQQYLQQQGYAVDCAEDGPAGLFMGNTAEDILTQLDCSVLTIKPPGFTSPVTLEG